MVFTSFSVSLKWPLMDTFLIRNKAHSILSIHSIDWRYVTILNDVLYQVPSNAWQLGWTGSSRKLDSLAGTRNHKSNTSLWWSFQDNDTKTLPGYFSFYPILPYSIIEQFSAFNEKLLNQQEWQDHTSDLLGKMILISAAKVLKLNMVEYYLPKLTLNHK